MINKYKNIVLEGNAMAGIAYIGVLKVLEEYDLIRNIKNFAGSSSGAIMATLLSLGYSSNELLSIVEKLDWQNMVKHRWWFLRIFHFWKRYGLYKYDNIEKTLKDLLLHKTGKSDMTFLEHYHYTGNKIIITGVNISLLECEFFSVDTHPNMSIIHAMKISTAFPFIFDPVLFNNMLYIDGGTMNNFPVQYFGYNNPETIGVNLIDDSAHKDHHISNIFQYGYNIIRAILLIQEHNDLNYKINTIYVKIKKASIFETLVQMNLNINELINNGIESTLEYIIQ